MDVPAIAAIIEISIDAENDTYKTKSYIELSDSYADEEAEMPRDILLSMIFELSRLASKLAEKADASIEEIDEYLTERKLLDLDSTDVEALTLNNMQMPSRKRKDAIDETIDNLFEDDE